MRADTKAELQMLRELAWLILPHLKCWFCKQPIIPPALGQNAEFGHRRHTKMSAELTWHHFDGDRSNNRFCVESLQYEYNIVNTNLVASHDSCHRRYHATKRAAERREIIKRVEEKQSEVSE